MRLKVASHRPEPDVIRRAVASLGSGGVIAYPTETFYGLAASAFDFEGCRRVFEIKGRRRSRALPLILANTSQLADVAVTPSALMQRLAEKFWPGPLTLVVEALPGSRRRLTSGRSRCASAVWRSRGRSHWRRGR